MVFLSNHNLTKKYLFLLPLLFLGVGNGQAPVDIFTHATKITSHSGWLEWKTDSSYFEEKRQFNLGHRTREILYCDIYNKRSVFKVKTLSLKYLTDSCTAPTISPNKQWALYGVDCESGVQIIAEQLNGKSIVSWHTSFDQSKEEGASLNRVVWISNEKWAMTISTLPHLYWLVGDLKRPGKVQKFNLKIHERMNGWSRHDLRIIGATDSNTALAVGPCWPAKSDVKHKIVQLSLFKIPLKNPNRYLFSPISFPITSDLLFDQMIESVAFSPKTNRIGIVLASFHEDTKEIITCDLEKGQTRSLGSEFHSFQTRSPSELIWFPNGETLSFKYDHFLWTVPDRP